MESLVVTLETARKLKATGFPQRTYWHYIFPTSEGWALIWKSGDGEWDFAPHEDNVEVVNNQVVSSIAAPTAQEIADQIPATITVRKLKRWTATWQNLPMAPTKVIEATADTMAEALALLWLRLQKPKRGLDFYKQIGRESPEIDRQEEQTN